MILLSSNNFLSILSSQFNHSWALLLQTIDSISDEKWIQVHFHDDENFWAFSLTVYHILETTEFYMQDSPEEMVWGRKGQIDWDSKLPLEKKIVHLTKSLIKQYLEEIKNELNSTLRLTHVDQLFTPDGFSWFPSVLDKYLYLLRHNMMV